MLYGDVMHQRVLSENIEKNCNTLLRKNWFRGTPNNVIPMMSSFWAKIHEV